MTRRLGMGRDGGGGNGGDGVGGMKRPWRRISSELAGYGKVCGQGTGGRVPDVGGQRRWSAAEARSRRGQGFLEGSQVLRDIAGSVEDER